MTPAKIQLGIAGTAGEEMGKLRNQWFSMDGSHDFTLHHSGIEIIIGDGVISLSWEWLELAKKVAQQVNSELSDHRKKAMESLSRRYPNADH